MSKAWAGVSFISNYIRPLIEHGLYLGRPKINYKRNTAFINKPVSIFYSAICLLQLTLQKGNKARAFVANIIRSINKAKVGGWKNQIEAASFAANPKAPDNQANVSTGVSSGPAATPSTLADLLGLGDSEDLAGPKKRAQKRTRGAGNNLLVKHRAIKQENPASGRAEPASSIRPPLYQLPTLSLLPLVAHGLTSSPPCLHLTAPSKTAGVKPAPAPLPPPSSALAPAPNLTTCPPTPAPALAADGSGKVTEPARKPQLSQWSWRKEEVCKRLG